VTLVFKGEKRLGDCGSQTCFPVGKIFQSHCCEFNKNICYFAVKSNGKNDPGAKADCFIGARFFDHAIGESVEFGSARLRPTNSVRLGRLQGVKKTPVSSGDVSAHAESSTDAH
jgi:hypothetical protein